MWGDAKSERSHDQRGVGQARNQAQRVLGGPSGNVIASGIPSQIRLNRGWRSRRSVPHEVNVRPGGATAGQLSVKRLRISSNVLMQGDDLARSIGRTNARDFGVIYNKSAGLWKALRELEIRWRG